MVRKILEAKITELYVNHYANVNFFRESGCAKMSLWAKTDTGHEVWLETVRNLNHDRVENKIRDYLEKSRYKEGETIKYVLKNKYATSGFIRKGK